MFDYAAPIINYHQHEIKILEHDQEKALKRL